MALLLAERLAWATRRRSRSPDGQFTVVLSVLGVMCAPDQAAAARELARVSAPGGRLGSVAWGAWGFHGRHGRCACAVPAATAGQPSGRWGDGSALSALLSSAGISLRETSRDYVVLDFADRSEAVEFLVRTAGHVLAERASLETEGRWQELVSARKRAC